MERYEIETQIGRQIYSKRKLNVLKKIDRFPKQIDRWTQIGGVYIHRQIDICSRCLKSDVFKKIDRCTMIERQIHRQVDRYTDRQLDAVDG